LRSLLRYRHAGPSTDGHRYTVHVCRPWLERASTRRGLRNMKGSQETTNLVRRRISLACIESIVFIIMILFESSSNHVQY
jgi:hypothetical protein